MKNTLRLLLICLLSVWMQGQAQVLDGIVAVVGEDIILKSDVENQYQYLITNGEKDDGSLRCAVLEQLLISKFLLNKAKQDSLVVKDEQVESEVDRRIMMIASQMGGEKKLEEVYKKSILEIRQDLRPDIKDQLLIDQQRQKIMNDIKATPREVKEFFKNIPRDSLPYLPAEVEIFQIVIKAPWSGRSKQRAMDKLETIREEIVNNGKSFEEMAKNFDMDASAENGGYLGEFPRGQMVPEFDDVVFNMKEGEISPVFESRFGFHIAKLHKRIGDKVRVSHIIIIPEKGAEDEKGAIDSLSKIRNRIQSDSLTFQSAAMRYSSDAQSKDCGGCVRNPQSGESRVPIDALDADLFLKVDEMKEGEISEPAGYVDEQTNERMYRIVYVKRKYPPHVANLTDDYQKLHNATIQSKQAVVLEKWFESAKKNIYLEIFEEDCKSALKHWQ